MYYYLVYVSSATELIVEDDLWRMLETFRLKNLSLGITGVLFYYDGNFMQLLEGTKETVLAMYAEIRADKRHFDSFVLVEGDIEEPLFSDWTMGFKSKNNSNPLGVVGFRHPHSDVIMLAPSTENTHESLVLLRSFYKNLQPHF